MGRKRATKGTGFFLGWRCTVPDYAKGKVVGQIGRPEAADFPRIQVHRSSVAMRDSCRPNGLCS
jgi:hypothetical protein